MLPLNQVLEDDCLNALSRFPEASVDLAYLDPPFNTGKLQSAAGAAYEDRWADLHHYLAYMRLRIEAVHRVHSASLRLANVPSLSIHAG